MKRTTGEVVPLFGACKSVQDVPQELVVSNNALAQKHLPEVLRLFDAAYSTCKESIKDMKLSGPAYCELTMHALVEMIEVAFEHRKCKCE